MWKNPKSKIQNMPGSAYSNLTCWQVKYLKTKLPTICFILCHQYILKLDLLTSKTPWNKITHMLFYFMSLIHSLHILIHFICLWMNGILRVVNFCETSFLSSWFFGICNLSPNLIIPWSSFLTFSIVVRKFCKFCNLVSISVNW